MNDINETLKELNIEDYVWIIYIFLSIFALISNYYEKNYIITKNKDSKKGFRTINTTIFIIVFFIYLYFVLLNYKEIKKLGPHNSPRKIFWTNAGFIASVLFLIAGIISLLISIFGDDEDDFLLNFF